MLLGTTFSHRQIQYLDLEVLPSLEKILTLNFDMLRFGVYWSEVEREPGVFDFSKIESLLMICQEKKQKVLLTLGAKAPRWPEFYIPAFLPQNLENEEAQNRTLQFVEKTTEKLKKYSVIEAWQVENEPLDPVWENKLVVPLDFLEKEIKLVKKIDNTRKILVSFWGNTLTAPKNLSQISSSVDLVGLDIYYQQFVGEKFGIPLYSGPRQRKHSLKKSLQKLHKPLWITELQAEPWEKNAETYRSDSPKSMSPKKLESFFHKASFLEPEAIFFWGCEYWLWRESQGDARYIEVARELLSENNK